MIRKRTIKRQINTLKTHVIKVHGSTTADHDVVYLESGRFSADMLDVCKRRFRELISQRRLLGNFEDDSWTIYNDVSHTEINFRLDRELYASHGMKYLHMPYDNVIHAMKCYSVLFVKSIIAGNIREKIFTIRMVLEHLGEGFSLPESQKNGFSGFAYFCGLSEQDCLRIRESLKPLVERDTVKKPRTLGHILTYLVIHEEITALFRNGTDEEKLKFFPVYFWAEVTFVLPLRATETTLTPRDCIVRRDGKVFLRVIRTKLKKRHYAVEYLVAEDYQLFEYPIPDGELRRNIEWYLENTADNNRQFLFIPNHLNTVEPLFRLHHLNELIREFIETYMIGNSNYDFAKSVVGMKEFEPVTAGDSRHIAMANLHFSDVSLEVCRQLADHENIDVSYSYATNVQQTLECSAIMRVQRQISDGLIQKDFRIGEIHADSVCLSEKRLSDPEDISDCELYQHISRCIGCPLYIPSSEELRKDLEKQREAVLKQAEELKHILTLDARVKGREAELEHALLMVHSSAERYTQALDITYQKGAILWQEQKILETTS